MKTVILGMNSPTGKVLEFDKANSAGGRLFKLAAMSPVVYSLCFKRMNLLQSTTWENRDANLAGNKMLPFLVSNYRTVVVLGERVWKALGLPPTEWLDCFVVDGTKFYSVPHTSGLCHYYNDDKNCRAVTKLLKRLASEGGDNTLENRMA